MAITNNDAYVTPQNVSITGAYMTFGTRRVLMTKDGSDYIIGGICCVYKDQTAKDTGFMCLKEFKVEKTIAVGDLTSNLYTVLYDELKLTYTNSVDV